MLANAELWRIHLNGIFFLTYSTSISCNRTTYSVTNRVHAQSMLKWRKCWTWKKGIENVCRGEQLLICNLVLHLLQWMSWRRLWSLHISTSGSSVQTKCNLNVTSAHDALIHWNTSSSTCRSASDKKKIRVTMVTQWVVKFERREEREEERDEKTRDEPATFASIYHWLLFNKKEHGRAVSGP